MTWEKLESAAAGCTRCPLCRGRTRPVFGVGSKTAGVMLVGEGPGRQEDEQGIPFVGPAGRLLDALCGSVGLSREQNIYIANIVKCRPPGNRDPLPEEQEACLPFLRGQFALLRPRVVVCVGRVAAARLIAPDFKISADHGRWFEKKGVRMMATFHPAALLRNPKQKADAFADFLKLMADLDEHGL